MTAVIAMIFMVIIAVLAIGFYALVTTSQSLAQNDQKSARALMAAESGLQFMRRELARVRIPPQATSADLLIELQKDLKADLENTDNLGLGALTVGLANETISIPAEANQTIATHPGPDKSGFVVTITKFSPSSDSEIVCTITGHCGVGASHRTRRVRLQFKRGEVPSSVLANAIAAQGRVNIMKGLIAGMGGVSSDTIANVMSTRGSAPAVAVSGGTLGGDISIVTPGLASITGGSVHGSSDATYIQNNYVNLVTPPEFPYVDTSVLAQYATNTYVSGMTTLTNVRVPANTGTAASPLKFSGNVDVRGIFFVESPNSIEFGGNATLEGMIVFQGSGSSAVNSIRFGGNATVTSLPPDPMFDALRSITGIAILAPTATITTAGSTDSYLKGNVIVGTFNEFGSATIKMDAGSIVTMDSGTSATFNGNTTRFLSTGIANPPSVAVKYSAKFIPDNGTYGELN